MHDRSNDTHTSDGVEITPGLWVWNNNLDSVQVKPEQFATEEARARLFRQADPTATVYSQVWYDTTGGSFNGTRMATVFEGLKASDFPGMTFRAAKEAHAAARFERWQADPQRESEAARKGAIEELVDTMDNDQKEN